MFFRSSSVNLPTFIIKLDGTNSHHPS